MLIWFTFYLMLNGVAGNIVHSGKYQIMWILDKLRFAGMFPGSMYPEEIDVPNMDNLWNYFEDSADPVTTEDLLINILLRLGSLILAIQMSLIRFKFHFQPITNIVHSLAQNKPRTNRRLLSLNIYLWKTVFVSHYYLFI